MSIRIQGETIGTVKMTMNANHHHHHHHVASDGKILSTEKRLIIAVVINVLIPIVQIIGGLYAHSVAILSDALHNLGDVLTLVLTYAAFLIARRMASTSHTYGYRRAEVIAAFFNAIVIIGASAVILKEAVEKFFNPAAISGQWVMGLAIVGMIGNGISALLLHSHAATNINVKSAFVHLMGDFLTSFAVLVGGVILLFKPWYWIDPLLSCLIVIFIVKGCWGIFRDALRILMEATPPDVDLKKVKESIESIQGVLGAHYLHAWTLSPSNVAFSCHVVVEDQPLSRVGEIRKAIEDTLASQFRINHPVLQFETAPCGTGGILCEQLCFRNDTPSEKKSQSSSHPGHSFSQALTRHKKIIFSVLRICFGGLFIFAGVNKILQPKAFAEVVFNYRILPDVLINLVAVVLPWVEVISGLCVVLKRCVTGGLTILNGLLILFSGLIIFNIVRGVDISCGCFSTEIETVSTTAMWLEVARDIGLLGIGLLLFRHYCGVGGVKSGTSGAREG